MPKYSSDDPVTLFSLPANINSTSVGTWQSAQYLLYYYDFQNYETRNWLRRHGGSAATGTI